MQGPVSSHGAGGGGGGGLAGSASQIQITIDGGGAVIAAGIQDTVRVPFNCVITAWELVGVLPNATNGTIQIDVWRDVWANYPPTVLDTLIGGGGTKPNLAGAYAARDAVLAFWTTALVAGEYLHFNVDAAPAPATLTRVKLTLTVVRT